MVDTGYGNIGFDNRTAGSNISGMAEDDREVGTPWGALRALGLTFDSFCETELYRPPL